MRIKKIISQYRRDFKAILECEHCGHEDKLDTGYDDDNYHKNVIPKFECPVCGKIAPEDYRTLTTKYQPWVVI